MKNLSLLFLTLCASGLLAGTASARTFGLPLDKPVAFITLPRSWQPKETKRGVEATSMDQAVYIVVDVVDNEKDLPAKYQEIYKMLHEKKVDFDEEKFEKHTEGQVNGLPMREQYWHCADLDGDARVNLITVPVKGKFVVYTSWLSEEEGKKNDEATEQIFYSLVSVDGVPTAPAAPADTPAPIRSSSKK